MQLTALGWPVLRSPELPRALSAANSVLTDLVLLAGRAARGARHVAAAEKKQKLMWEALREAVDEEMEADPTVCLMGATPAGKISSAPQGHTHYLPHHVAVEPAHTIAG